MNTKVDMTYRFSWDVEPTDEQLSVIMEEVAEEARCGREKVAKPVIENIKKEVAQEAIENIEKEYVRMLDRKTVLLDICQRMTLNPERDYTSEELLSTISGLTGQKGGSRNTIAVLCDTLSFWERESAIAIIRDGQRIVAPRLTPENIEKFMFRLTDAGKRIYFTLAHNKPNIHHT